MNMILKIIGVFTLAGLSISLVAVCLALAFAAVKCLVFELWEDEK